MTKRAEAKYKIDRRMGQNIWGRPRSPVNKREYGPGQHGQRRKGKATDFGTQLKAKQKLKGYYGNILERQFHKYYVEAVRMKGDSSANLIGLLERRLDAFIYRAKFVPTVFAARQFVNHGHLTVNGRRVNIASYLVKVGDLVEIKESSRQLAIVIEVGGARRTRRARLSRSRSRQGQRQAHPHSRPDRSALSDADGAQPGHRILFALTSSRVVRKNFQEPPRRGGSFVLAARSAQLDPEPLGDEQPAVAQAFRVDAVADAEGEMPLVGNARPWPKSSMRRTSLRAGSTASWSPCTSRIGGGSPLALRAVASPDAQARSAVPE